MGPKQSVISVDDSISPSNDVNKQEQKVTYLNYKYIILSIKNF